VTGNWNAYGDTHFIRLFTANVLSKIRTNIKLGDVIIAPPILYLNLFKDELVDR